MHTCGHGARAKAAPPALLVVSFAGRNKDLGKVGNSEKTVCIYKYMRIYL